MENFQIKFEFAFSTKKYHSYKNGLIAGRWITLQASEPIYYGIPNYMFTIYGSYGESKKLNLEMRSKDNYGDETLLSNLIESENHRNIYYGENMAQKKWNIRSLNPKSYPNTRHTNNDFFILEFYPINTEAIIYVAPNCSRLKDRDTNYRGKENLSYEEIDNEDFEDQKSQLKALLKPISHTLLLAQIIGKNLINDERKLKYG